MRNGQSRGARGIVYLPKNADDLARKVLERVNNPPPTTQERPHAPKGLDAVDRSTAELVLAPCYATVIDRLYNNPEVETPCRCEQCSTTPPLSRPASCNCSRCQPEDLASAPVGLPVEPSAAPTHPAGAVPSQPAAGPTPTGTSTPVRRTRRSVAA